MSKRGEVLVAIVNKKLDFAILREQLWYRIPVSSVEKWIKERWSPKWLAFYQTNGVWRRETRYKLFCRSS